MKYKGVIFDMDGTLLDSMGTWESIDRTFFAKRGMEMPQDFGIIAASMGMEQTAHYAVEHYLPHESPQAIIAEWMEMSLHAYEHELKLKEGALPFLKYLKERGVKIGLATASPMACAVAALQNNGILSYFDALSAAGETKRTKGYPDLYLLTAGKLSLRVCQCLVAEDLLRAVEGAVEGGFDVVAVHDRESAAHEAEIVKLARAYVYRLDELCKTDWF